MGTIQAAAAVWKRAPLLLRAGILCGLVTGLAVGAMGSPLAAGLLGGAFVGGLIGTIAGFAMHLTDQRRVHRTKQLDDIIGVTSGSLGTAPGSIPPGDLERDPEDVLELESWKSEWLTPPPPAFR
jgi:hypothetical protein